MSIHASSPCTPALADGAAATADSRAAAKMGQLLTHIRALQPPVTAADRRALYVFCSRLLFCFFAQDLQIFAAGSFTRLIEQHSHDDGRNINQILGDLFVALKLPPDSPRRATLPPCVQAFPHVGGGWFETQEPVPVFNTRTRRLLLECSRLDWSAIHPDIFGALFQSLIAPQQRSRLGQHYTSVSNILQAIRPLFVDELHTALQEILHSRCPAAERLQALSALAARLVRMKIFDPACGSGNFLVTAYQTLRQLEIDIVTAISAIDGSAIYVSQISLAQLYGLELDADARQLALLSLWLAERQMDMRYRRVLARELPARAAEPGAHIRVANSLHIDWEDFCPRPNRSEDEVYLLGNPPFGGTTHRSGAQSADMDHVFAGWKKYALLDYAACWLWKGAQYIRHSCARLALVLTNSLCQGEQVATVWPQVLAQGCRIDFAYQSFPWRKQARGRVDVHVVLIGLAAAESGPKRPARLYQQAAGLWQVQAVAQISPYLTAGSHGVVRARKKPLCAVPPMVRGNQATDGGHLILNRAEKEALLRAEPQAARWLKQLCGAAEFLHGQQRWCIWLADMDAEALAQLSASHPQISKRVAQSRAYRAAGRPGSDRLRLAGQPHLFRDVHHPARYIVLPRVSSAQRAYLPLGFLDGDTIPSDAVHTIPHATDYQFGILSSAMHHEWMRTVAGRLKSDYRYSAELVYNTFPWPQADVAQQQVIAALAQAILRVRADFPEQTLADLYHPDTMPAPLYAAHQALDRAVDRLYRAQAFTDGMERVAFLFDCYEALLGYTAE